MSKPAELMTQVVEHIKCAHAALDAAHADQVKAAAVQKDVQGRIPAVVEALVQHGRIDPADREKAARALADPVLTLDILLKAANVNETIHPRPLGTPAGPTVKQADYRYPGERTGRPSAADEKFVRDILG